MMDILNNITSSNLLDNDDKIYWSPSTGGFYVNSVHGNNRPADVVIVDKSLHSQLLYLSGRGYVIVKGDDGLPKAVKKQVDMTRVLSSIRSRRNKLLLESDYIELPSMQASLTEEKKLEWANYRQALRDITDQPDLLSIDWPVKP